MSLVRDSLQARAPIGGWSAQRVSRLGYQHLINITSQMNFYYFWEKRWFFLAMALGFFMLTLPLPSGLSQEGMIVLTMSVVATILFVTEPVPLPTAAPLDMVLVTSAVKADNAAQRPNPSSANTPWPL